MKSNAGIQTRGGSSAPRAVEFEDLEGCWRSHGYGTVLEIAPRHYVLHEETRASCLQIFQGSLEELAEHYVEVRVSPGGQSFSARRAAGVTRVKFRRLGRLPAICEELPSGSRSDPETNFEIFWHHFAEHYALFDLRGVDWDETYARHRPRVDESTSAAELFEIFADMVRPLRDGHVELRRPGGHFDAGVTGRLHARLARELGAPPDSFEVAARLVELRRELDRTIRERYLGGRSRRACGGLLEWGGFDESTGYLAVRAMAALSGAVGWPRDDVEALDEAMERVLADLGRLERLVVDVRGNGGGYDSVALRLAGYLTDRKRRAFSKAARRGEGYTGQQWVRVAPGEHARFRGHLVVLTSGLTASAAEVFLLALLRHPRLTLVGEPTMGILSDAMERHLPNGWAVTLSNELYRAWDGELYEDRGIPPHVEIPFLGLRDRRAARDSMLDHAVG